MLTPLVMLLVVVLNVLICMFTSISYFTNFLFFSINMLLISINRIFFFMNMEVDVRGLLNAQTLSSTNQSLWCNRSSSDSGVSSPLHILPYVTTLLANSSSPPSSLPLLLLCLPILSYSSHFLFSPVLLVLLHLLTDVTESHMEKPWQLLLFTTRSSTHSFPSLPHAFKHSPSTPLTCLFHLSLLHRCASGYRKLQPTCGSHPSFSPTTTIQPTH